VPFQIKRSKEGKASLITEMKAGLHFLWQHSLLRTLALLTMSVNFLLVGSKLAVIVLVQQQLHLSTPMLGLIIGAEGVGGLLGGIIAPWVHKRLRLGQIILGSVLAWSISQALCAMATSFLPLVIGRAIGGFIWPLYAVAVVTYRLSLVPDTLQGRVNSAFRLLSFGIESIGVFIAGLLLVPFGPRLEIGSIALGLALCLLVVGCTPVRRAR
jgi:MFS family permease